MWTIQYFFQVLLQSYGHPSMHSTSPALSPCASRACCCYRINHRSWDLDAVPLCDSIALLDPHVSLPPLLSRPTSLLCTESVGGVVRRPTTTTCERTAGTRYKYLAVEYPTPRGKEHRLGRQRCRWPVVSLRVIYINSVSSWGTALPVHSGSK